MSDPLENSQYIRMAIYWLCVIEGYNAFWQGVAYKEDQTSADLTEAIAWRHGWRSAAWNAQQHRGEAPSISTEGASWAMETLPQCICGGEPHASSCPMCPDPFLRGLL